MRTGSKGLVLDAGIVFATVGNDHPLRLDVLQPAERTRDRLPAVIWVHGGGWLEGWYIDGDSWWCCPPLAAAGFITVSISYRMSDEAVFPAQIHDVKGAIRWVRANAADLGVDPARIGIWGHSAGGHLAALAGVTGDLPELEGTVGPAGHSSAVQAVVTGSPPTDFTGDGQALTGEAISYVASLFGGIGPEKRVLMRLASPACRAHAGAAPTLVVHGDADELVPVSQGDILVERLRAAGAPVEYERMPGADHMLFAGERRYPREHGLERFGDLARAFFQRHLCAS